MLLHLPKGVVLLSTSLKKIVKPSKAIETFVPCTFKPFHCSGLLKNTNNTRITVVLSYEFLLNKNEFSQSQ